MAQWHRSFIPAQAAMQLNCSDLTNWRKRKWLCKIVLYLSNKHIIQVHIHCSDARPHKRVKCGQENRKKPDTTVLTDRNVTRISQLSEFPSNSQFKNRVLLVCPSLSLASRTCRKVSELWTEPSSPEIRNVRESRIKKSLESENFSLRTGSQRLMSSAYAGWHTIDRNVANRLNSTQQTDLGLEKARTEQSIEAEARDALNFWNRSVLSLPLKALV